MAWFPIILAIGYLLPICLQPPETTPAKPESTVPLAQLPWSNSQAIVVTDDLKKALDALGASSVVISAERYREMMNQLKAQAGSGEKRPTEMLFSRCHISGEVKNQDGHEVAQLHFDLECRTQTPHTEVPLPFKGLRFTSASVNNNTPIFGPDPERPSLIISEPQVVKIHLEASVNLSRNGNEFRLNLPRIPSAAMTSLDLSVPGQVKEASIPGYGNVNVSKKNSTSSLQASALGVLSSLDLAWRLFAPNSSSAIPIIESETKITLDDTTALVEVKLSPVPFTSLGLPWTLRLPMSATQIQAELIRPASAISEPLAVKKNSDGMIVLSPRYATGAAEYTQVYLRYKQALPSPNTTEKTMLGMCDVSAPSDRQQNGVMTVNLPEDAVVLLRPINLIQADAQSVREGKRILNFRFSNQGAGLEAIPLPRSIVRGAVEAKLQHTLSVRDGAWVLLTDLEVTRSSRANPATLDFFWPADWPVNRKVLFSPIIRDIDQDQANHHLRVRLDGKKVGSFALHLESAPVASSSAINPRFPYLVSVQNSQENPMEIVLTQERLRVEPHGCNIKFLGEANGVEEAKTQNSGSELRDMEFSITSHPATLSVIKETLLPVIQSHADVYLDPKLLQIAQTFQIKFDGPIPKHFPILCPIFLKQIQFTLAEPERVAPTPSVVTSIPLKATKVAGTGNEVWDRYLLEVPESLKNNFDFIVVATLEHNLGTVTIPLIRPAEPLSPNNLSVHCVADRRISLLKLPAELPGWTLVSQADSGPEGQIKQLVLQSTTPERLLALQIEGRRSDYASNSAACRVRQADIEVKPAGNSFMRCRGVWQLRDVGSTQLTLSMQEPFQNINVDRCLVNGKMVSTTASWNSDQGCTQVPITLHPQNLSQSAEIVLEFTLLRQGLLHSWWTTIPRICFGGAGVSEKFYPQSWRICTGRSSWLLYASQPLDDSWGRSMFLPCVAGADESYQFQTIDSATSLSLCALPPSAIVLICSFFSFLAMKFASRIKTQQEWGKDQGTGLVNSRKVTSISPLSPPLGLFLLLVAGVLFLLPVTGAALFWSSFPGVVMGLLLVCIEHFLAGHRKNENVFLSAGLNPTPEGDRWLNVLRPDIEHDEADRMSNDPTYCRPSNGAMG